MRAATLLAALVGAMPALAAVQQVGNTCTVTPLSADAAANRRRQSASAAAPDVDTGAPRVADEKYPAKMRDALAARQTVQGEKYPRPEPGSDEARVYDRAAAPAAAARAPDTSSVMRISRAVAEVGEADGEDATVDDTPQILEAFQRCGHDGHIVFSEGTYNIRQVMNTTDLRNCDIDILGTFIWSGDNIQYWLSHSYSVTYAGRSTAWLLGGTNISMRGHGKALFNGNGQIWIDENRSQGNQNGRPISLTIWYGTNVFVDGISWHMAQFWHTFVAHSQNVTMTNLQMYTQSRSQYSAVNTDGTDTWNSRDVYISNWNVTCGDDCISIKGNSTNVHVSNVVCHQSGCACIGTVGSNPSQPDYVDNILFENITCDSSSNAAWIKTYPGSGHVRNVTFKNFVVKNVDQPIYLTPCSYSGLGCDTSRLSISDITWKNITGTSRYNIAAAIHCPSSDPCTDLHFEDIDIKPINGGTAKILCANIQDQATSGLTCTGTCPANWPQQLNGNR